MKYIVILLATWACSLQAHDIQGEFVRDGKKSVISRTTIPLDSSKKTADGRVYTLWIAPDGAFVFYLKNSSDKVDLDLTKPDPRFRIWLVEAESETTLPKGFEDLSSDAKSKVEKAEELIGHIKITWKSDLDYAISLDVKGTRKKAAFTGYLFGGPKNVPDKN